MSTKKVNLEDTMWYQSQRIRGYFSDPHQSLGCRCGEKEYISQSDTHLAVADLEETARAALHQIEDRRYDTELINRGIPAENIHKFGFAFRGKEVLIKEAML